jgi:competence protein ComEC
MKHYFFLVFLFFLVVGRVIIYLCFHKTVPESGVAVSTSGYFSDLIVVRVAQALPSPHSQLLLGMTLGIDDMSSVKKFKDTLISTGTIHVVVVSGFNINLVFDFAKKFFGSTYRKRNLFLALITTFIYALVAGFKPPVFRAWIMCAVANVGKFYGRLIEPLAILIFTGMVMVLYQPELLFSLSFQLSFMASYGLLEVCPLITKVIAMYIKKENWFLSDLSTTLSATIAVWPLISFNFGRISLISLLVNPVVLWSVPLITLIGICVVPVMLIGKEVAEFIGIILFPLLDFFVRTINLFGLFSSNLNLQIPLWFLGFYYFVLVCLVTILRSNFAKKVGTV